ncbi:hypothetical protein BPODLACK_04329 [Gordonia sp. YY1]|nr:hypothetical protein BPODLACK_04329 [Gordonia sp. YY1]
MGYREVAVEEIREVLRLWLGLAVGLPSPGLRTIAAHCGSPGIVEDSSMRLRAR